MYKWAVGISKCYIVLPRVHIKRIKRQTHSTVEHYEPYVDIEGYFEDDGFNDSF